MTSRTATRPATTEQAQQLPQELSPYTKALLLAYLASSGAENQNTERRTKLFGKVLAASALAAFALTPSQKRDLNVMAAAQPFAEEARKAANQYRENNPDADEGMTEKFVSSAAETLSTGVSNRTTLEVLKALDPDGLVYKKLWLTRGDDKVRLSHRELHGKTASVGDSFKPGLSYPGDPSAPLDERINCRCFLWAVPASEDVATAHAFEPADLDMAFAASAAITAAWNRNTLKKLMRVAPWKWQPRDSIGRWVEVGDVVYAPASSGKGRERGKVIEVTGRDRVRLESLRFPGREWDVDSRDTFADVSKANLPGPGIDRSVVPTRSQRSKVTGLGPEIAGAPIFNVNELKPGDVVVVEAKSKPGEFRHMIVYNVNEPHQMATMFFAPEPTQRGASSEEIGPDAPKIFQLMEKPILQQASIQDGVLYEPASKVLADEVAARWESRKYGFANPYWFNSTDDAFKTGADRSDWVPERKELHDKIIADTFDQARVAQGPAKFYMMGGGPSSGKSTMLLADAIDIPLAEEGIQINADDIKPLLPEYVGMLEAEQQGAAAFVHKESSEISSRMIRESPMDKHVVLDGVGDKGAAAVLARLETANARGQRTIANYATLPTDMAVQLSNARGQETGRFVPEDYIRRAHADVTDTFFDLAKLGALDELYLWNTEQWDAERKVGIPRAIFSQVDGVSTIHDEALLLEFLNKSRSKRHTLQSVQALTQSGFEFPNPNEVEMYLDELEGMPLAPATAPAAVAAAADTSQLWDSLDWDTLEDVLIEVASEQRGAQFESAFPADDPTINALKKSLKAEFPDASKQIDVISNP